MKTRTIAVLLTGATAFALITPSSAKTVKPDGEVCWTGDIEVITSGKGNMAWSWKIDVVFASSDNDPKKAAEGQCVGSGGVVNGKPEVAPTFCLYEHAAGGKYMERVIGGPKGTKGTYFGGTGRLAGITGSFTEGPTTKRPADKGKLSGCRPFKGEYSISG